MKVHTINLNTNSYHTSCIIVVQAPHPWTSSDYGIIYFMSLFET